MSNNYVRAMNHGLERLERSAASTSSVVRPVARRTRRSATSWTPGTSMSSATRSAARRPYARHRLRRERSLRRPARDLFTHRLRRHAAVAGHRHRRLRHGWGDGRSGARGHRSLYPDPGARQRAPSGSDGAHPARPAFGPTSPLHLDRRHGVRGTVFQGSTPEPASSPRHCDTLPST